MEIKTVVQQLLFNTVLLELQDRQGNLTGIGTSFIISHESKEHGDELFLVTNKHVVKDAYFGNLFLTIRDQGNPNIGNVFTVKIEGVESQCCGHPSEDVDISVMPLGWQIDLISRDGIKPYLKEISTKIIANEDEIEEMDAVCPVIFIGYPNGLYDTQNFTPIVRTGITATPVQLDYCGRPVFLIDASVFPGSSGSPVFSYNLSWKGNIVDVKLLGIVAEVMIQRDQGIIETLPAPTQVTHFLEIRQMIDLGVVFKAHLITETINNFWKRRGDLMPS